MKSNLVKILIFFSIIFISYKIVEFSLIFGIIVFILFSLIFVALISDINKFSAKNVILEVLTFLLILFISYKISQYKIWFGIIVFIISSLIFCGIYMDINEKYEKNKKLDKGKKSKKHSSDGLDDDSYYKGFDIGEEKDYKDKDEAASRFRAIKKEIDKLREKEIELEKREKELEEKERDALNKAAEAEAMKEKLKEKEQRIEEMLEKIRMENEEETKKDKIAVTTAINIGIRLVEKFLNKLKDLNEKYSEGTHLHFAVTLYEFTEVEEELKNSYNIIKNSIEEYGYPFTIWLEEIDKYLKLYSENKEYCAYDKAYKYCLLALAYCYSYAIMINIIIIRENGTSSEERKTEYEESSYRDIPKEFQNEDGTLANYYQILWEDEYIESEYEKYVTYTRKDIDKQYKEMAKKYHPDKHTDDKEYAEAKFKEIQNAKDMLFERRDEYDEIYLEYFRKKYY
ncbi:J domain-containing protein [Brachyspira alvinipulli]|uniref:J domain-containing protein n=1 Tax=Brachyspira alvinipulli TaxID=84379 RepID=UPI000486C732|nr:DnaJ domain-containing protein [Brachyspira alvinipulli]